MERSQPQPQVKTKDASAVRAEHCEFWTTQEHLQRALRLVSGVVGKNPSLPILSNVLVKGEHGQLRLSTTDLEVGVTVWIGGKLQGEGAITVPFRTFSEYLQNIPNGPVELKIQRGSLTISVRGAEKRKSGAHAVFQGETAENFPLIPHLGEGTDISLPLPASMHALESVLYALATDDTRPELASLFVHGEGSVLAAAATDSYRLAEARVRLAAPLSSPVSVMIPSRAAREMQRVLEGGEESVLRIGESQLLLFTPTVQLVSRRVEGTYPDYTQVIPARTPTTLTVGRVELLRSIRAAAVFSETMVSRVKLEVGSDHILVTAVTPELGETKNMIPAEVSGEPLTIEFNTRFLKDALNILQGEQVQMGLGGATTPAVLRPVRAEKTAPTKEDAPSAVPEILALIMPIKT